MVATTVGKVTCDLEQRIGGEVRSSYVHASEGEASDEGHEYEGVIGISVNLNLARH